tara:strand:+ start:7049 stop:7945 length:897 start_codon:yes stop_codon:yes gene_type:complete
MFGWTALPRRAGHIALVLGLVLLTCVTSSAVATNDAKVYDGKIHLGNYAYPEPVVLGPISGTEAKAVVILLHGLGGAAKGMESIFSAAPFKNIRWIFPVAPLRNVQLNYDREEPAWYDMRTLNPQNMWNDEVGIEESSQYIRQMVLQIIREGVPANRIVLGGFSQGGAVALTTAVHALDGIAIGGVIALSSYLPMHQQYVDGTRKVSSVARNVPFFLAHGDADPVLDISMGRATQQALWQMGMQHVEFHALPGLGHTRNMEEAEMVKEFIGRSLISVVPPLLEDVRQQGANPYGTVYK